jgi:hypothetical protein
LERIWGCFRNRRTRDELIGVLTEIVHATRSRLSEARTSDGLKAAEMLAKMCGWNGPERHMHEHVEIRVDAGLIEQLRAGYAALGAREAKLTLGGSAQAQAQACLPGAPVGGATEAACDQPG